MAASVGALQYPTSVTARFTRGGVFAEHAARPRGEITANAYPARSGIRHQCSGQRRSQALSVEHVARTKLNTRRRVPVSRVVCKGAGGAASSGSQDKGDKGLWERLLNVRWDSSARSWENFWNMKTAGTVVDADLDTGSVAATPIRTIGLNVPESKEVCLDRLDANLVFYRQNYLLFGIFSSLLSAALTNAAMLLGLVALVCAGACRSNNLLGEAQLLLEDSLPPGKAPLTWNETRVMGVDRVLASKVLAAAGVLLILVGQPLNFVFVVGKSALLTVFAALAHGCTRPLSFTSWGSNVIQDLREVTSREELAAKAKRAWASLRKTVNQKAQDGKKKAPDPFTIFNVRGTGTQDGKGTPNSSPWDTPPPFTSPGVGNPPKPTQPPPPKKLPPPSK